MVVAVIDVDAFIVAILEYVQVEDSVVHFGVLAVELLSVVAVWFGPLGLVFYF